MLGVKKLTPLHLALWAGNVDTASLLLQMGAKPSKTDESKSTAFHKACSSAFHS